MKRAARVIAIILVSLLGLWALAEILMRLYLEIPLQTGFYGSIPSEIVAQHQSSFGVQVSSGVGWAHLGWIADPDNESYQIVKLVDGEPQQVGETRYGSYLLHNVAGTYQVWALSSQAGEPRILGTVEVQTGAREPPIYTPRIAAPWLPLFKPQVHGSYLNDHTIYQDAQGNWRLVGITSLSDGDFNAERYFAVGVSPDFPPADGMREQEPVADFGELAWAPHVITHAGTYHMFWSPHKLHQMTSSDGIVWDDHQVTMPTPYHKFFRDPMLLQVAPSQWLLYTTARGTYFSQVDLYQSFDLREWQYIRTALRSSFGSERNAPFASTESPFVTLYQGRYYLTLTYNNDSFFWPGIMMTFKIWPDRESYNETLVFHSDNPYDFGIYRGVEDSPTLLTQLETHAPEIVYHPEKDNWYITTVGWPWVATLTSGEAAVAPLQWDPVR